MLVRCSLGGDEVVKDRRDRRAWRAVHQVTERGRPAGKNPGRLRLSPVVVGVGDMDLRGDRNERHHVSERGLAHPLAERIHRMYKKCTRKRSTEVCGSL